MEILQPKFLASSRAQPHDFTLDNSVLSFGPMNGGSMSGADTFTNYYDVLQVSPNCTLKVLESAYRHLAKAYHPDHPETADLDRFTQVVEAYRSLREPALRAEYDDKHRARIFGEEAEHRSDVDPFNACSAASDADVHERMLLLLYRRRRESARDAGIGNYHLQESVGCSDEHFEFHAWYLKSKGFIEITEQGTLAITIDGVDHVISLTRASQERTRLLASPRSE